MSRGGGFRLASAQLRLSDRALSGQQRFERCRHVGVRQLRECPPDARRVEGHVDSVHRERRAGLAGELWLQTGSGHGHRVQGEAGDVANGGRTADGLLQERSDLIKGQVVGAADLQNLATQTACDYGVANEGRDVGSRDEVDRVGSSPEYKDFPGSFARLLHDLSPGLHEGSGPHDGPRDAAGAQRLFGRVLGPEEPDGVIRCCADQRDQDKRGADAVDSVDQV